MTLEGIIKNDDLCIYNDKSPTDISPFSGIYSAIDLSLCDRSIYIDVSWKVLANAYGLRSLINRHNENSEHKDNNSLRWKLDGTNLDEF